MVVLKKLKVVRAKGKLVPKSHRQLTNPTVDHHLAGVRVDYLAGCSGGP